MSQKRHFRAEGCRQSLAETRFVSQTEHPADWDDIVRRKAEEQQD